MLIELDGSTSREVLEGNVYDFEQLINIEYLQCSRKLVSLGQGMVNLCVLVNLCLLEMFYHNNFIMNTFASSYC
jgi:hypothetical protein